MTDGTARHRILLVCRGNTCRSAMAEGVLRGRTRHHGLGDHVGIDSAGTHATPGQPADSRAIAAASRRGIDLSAHRTQRLDAVDLTGFDRILAMDDANLAHVASLLPVPAGSSPTLLLDVLPGVAGRALADPYGGGPEDYERALDQICAACDALVDQLKRSS